MSLRLDVWQEDARVPLRWLPLGALVLAGCADHLREDRTAAARAACPDPWVEEVAPEGECRDALLADLGADPADFPGDDGTFALDVLANGMWLLLSADAGTFEDQPVDPFLTDDFVETMERYDPADAPGDVNDALYDYVAQWIDGARLRPDDFTFSYQNGTLNVPIVDELQWSGVASALVHEARHHAPPRHIKCPNGLRTCDRTSRSANGFGAAAASVLSRAVDGTARANLQREMLLQHGEIRSPG